MFTEVFPLPSTSDGGGVRTGTESPHTPDKIVMVKNRVSRLFYLCSERVNTKVPTSVNGNPLKKK